MAVQNSVYVLQKRIKKNLFIMGIFTSEKKAQEIKDEFSAGDQDTLIIDEYQLDKFSLSRFVFTGIKKEPIVKKK